jgi:hypothetical protein
VSKPEPTSIDHHVLRNVEHIDNTNDLWLAEATRAVKNPGKGDYMVVLIGPGTHNDRHTTFLDDEGSYTLRGYLKPFGFQRFKVSVESPSRNYDTPWVAAHHAIVYATDFATARRLLIVLAKELCYDRT